MQVTLFKQEDYDIATGNQRSLTIDELSQAITLYKEIQTQVLPVDLASKDLNTINSILECNDRVNDLDYDEVCEFISFSYNKGGDVEIMVSISTYYAPTDSEMTGSHVIKLGNFIEIYVKGLSNFYVFDVTGNSFELKPLDK